MANTKTAGKKTTGRQAAAGPAPDRGAWREVVGIILIGIGLVLLWFVFDTGSSAGRAVNSVLIGLAGLLRYLIPVAFVWAGIMLAFTNKDQKIKVGRLILIVLLVLCVCAAFHVFVYDGVTRDIGTYTFKNYVAASYAYRHGGGGVLGAILCWPLYYWMGLRAGGTIIMLILIFMADLVLMRKVSLRDIGAKMQERYEDYIEQRAARPEQPVFGRRGEQTEPMTTEGPKTKRARKADLDELEMWPEQKKAEAVAEKPQRGRKAARKDDELASEAEALIQDARKRQASIAEMNVPRFNAEEARRPKREIEPIEAEAPEDAEDDVPDFLMGRTSKGKRHLKETERMRVKEPKPLFGKAGAGVDMDSDEDEAALGRKIKSGSTRFPAGDADSWREMSIGDALYDEDELKAMAEAVSGQPDDSAFVTEIDDDEPPFELPGESYRLGELPPGGLRLPKAKPAPKPVIGGVAAMPLAKPAPKADAAPRTDVALRPGVGMDKPGVGEGEEPYNYPPIDLLAASKPSKIKNQEQLDQDKARILIETLQSFGITARLTGIAHGPTVTRFELSPAPGIKVSRITALADDIALNLAAVSVRIEAPIPGKAAVGVEVPNDNVEVVPLRDVLESGEARRHPSRLAVALGRDNAGRYIVADLAKMPHVLIAGATGAGKSVCINCLICSILYRATPDEVKLIMVDPKVVELSVYNGIPHLETPVVTDPKKAAGALQWAVNEMTTRYKKFADTGVRDLVGYNQRLPEGEKPMPQIVIIIDELADLMMVTPGEVEDAICRLAQLARAAGIHLVIATQRPSVNVITGVIKANIPSRIAFTVASQVDSRTILDVGGAEKLLGRGDMLFAPSGTNKPARVQGAWVSDSEVHDVVTYIKDLHAAEYNEDLMEFVNNADLSDAEKEEAAAEYDEMLPQAIEICVEAGQASISMLQRRLRVGYARAGRLIDEMASRGVVSQAEGAKPRNVLVTREQFKMMFED